MFTEHVNDDASRVRKRQRVDNPSTIACNALAIVLQRWLIAPHLSFPEINLQSFLPDLLQKIVLASDSVVGLTEESSRVIAENQRRKEITSDWKLTAINGVELSLALEDLQALRSETIVPFSAIENVCCYI